MISSSVPVRPHPFAAQRTAFRRRLQTWYQENGRDLPWRHTRDPYAILVSELMLQQTQVATVIPYYERWLGRFPDFAMLAAAPESDVLHAWQGLGYYARARNLHAAAKAVVAQHGGVFPETIEEARELSGVGRYTANAVATFAFDRSVPLVEANIARLLSRVLDLQLRIDSAAGQAELWSFAAALVPRKNAGVFNSALMDLGATVCVSGPPRCSICPVRGLCLAKEPATLPRKGARAALKLLVEHHLFLVKRGRLLLEQSQDRWRGMWILPRLASAPEHAPLLHSADFPFTHHRITLAVHGSKKLPPLHGNHRWFPIAKLADIPLPSPHRRAVMALVAQEK